MFPCARERDFEKIVLLAADTEFLQKMCDFASPQQPKILQKSIQNVSWNVDRGFWAPETDPGLQNGLQGGGESGIRWRVVDESLTSR